MNKPTPREGFVTDGPADDQIISGIVPPSPTVEAVEQSPPVEEQEPIDVEVWPIKVKLLHKMVRDNKGNELRELSFRQPTGGDINRYGMPVHIDVNGDVVIDPRRMTLMMTALSGVMSPFLEQMDPRDWSSCAYRLRRFFLPDPAAW